MSKWLCIDASNMDVRVCLIVAGEIYEGEYNQLRDLVYISKDGIQYGYMRSRFKPLAEIREEQIKSIFDDE
jgi:hypothetical protein